EHALGGVFEHSPWIAARALEARPFASVEALHAAMVAVVRRASRDEQLALLGAHPDLAGRAARAGALTNASAAEQSSAGLDRPAGLTTHVLDTSRGRPAARLRIDCSRLDADGRPRLIRTVVTNADGRVDGPLLGPAEMEAGRYELLFHVGAYFRTAGIAQ